MAKKKSGISEATRRAVLEMTGDGSYTLLEQSSPCSVELSTDSKGVVKVCVKAYGATVEEADAQAEPVFDALREKYGAEVSDGR